MLSHTRFYIYACVAVLATLSDWTLFFILNHFVHLNYKIAVIIGLTLGATVSYTLNKKVTFKDPTRAYFQQIGIFIVANVASMIMSYYLMHVLVASMQVQPMPARMLTTLIMFVFFFIVNRGITFNTALYSKK